MAEGESSSSSINIDELASSMRRELNYYWSLGEDQENGTNLCLIYKVPQHIRNVDWIAYKPIILSIGPYHHGTPALQAMEKEKWNCLDYILKLNREVRLRDYLNEITGLLKQVRSCYTDEIKMENKKFLQMLLLDGCYILVSLYGTDGIVMPTEKVCDASSTFPEIIEENEIEQKQECVGCGELEGTSKGKKRSAKHGHRTKKNSSVKVEMRQVKYSQQVSGNDKGKNKQYGQNQTKDNPDQLGKWYLSFVVHDLFLLENQIPFYVVKRIYELLAGKQMPTSSLTNRIANFVEKAVYYYPKAVKECDRPKGFHHLLHLCHMYFRPRKRMEEDYQYHTKPHYLHRFLSLGRKYFKLIHQAHDDEENSSLNQLSDCLQVGYKRWRRAVQYYEAGVEFKRKEFDKYNPHSLLDITFCKGELEIPCLPVDENTGPLFRNLIAFEQTSPQFGNDVSAYVLFMSQLISTPEDVTLLAQRGIIVHILRSDKEVSTLFTELSKDVVLDFDGKHYLKSIYWMMEVHYQSRMKRWMAWLKNNKFSNPWLALGVFAAVFVLFCTILQTLIAFFSFTGPTTDYHEP